MDRPGDRLVGTIIRLRPPDRSDLAVIHGWYEDPERSSPFDRFSIDSLDDLAESVDHAPEQPQSLAPRFVIEPVRGGPIVGCVGHYRAHPVLSLLELWYLMGDAAARGKGMGREAVALLTTHLFETTEVDRIGATCDVENTASFRLLEGLGFRREGTLRSALFHHARWHDVYVYGVTRSEWRVRKAPTGRTGPGPGARP